MAEKPLGPWTMEFIMLGSGIVCMPRRRHRASDVVVAGEESRLYFFYLELQKKGSPVDHLRRFPQSPL